MYGMLFFAAAMTDDETYRLGCLLVMDFKEILLRDNTLPPPPSELPPHSHSTELKWIVNHFVALAQQPRTWERLGGMPTLSVSTTALCR